MKPCRGTTVLLVLGACSVSPLTLAIEPLPETPGWRGFVILGAGYTDLESNLIAGNRLVDVGEETIATVSDGPERMRELMSWGVEFDKNGGNGLNLGREGGHTQRRILHKGHLHAFRRRARHIELVARQLP
jgi:hypothetical protein